jgi:group I intron endonuclease
MNSEMSITKGVIWEEKNLTEPEKNCLNNNVIEPKDITNEIKNVLIKKVWKDTGKVSGIYKIINKVNGKYYVGSSQNVYGNCFGRWEEHLRDLKNNIHSNGHLQKSWNKYGKDNFEFILIKKVNISELLVEEQKYLDIAKTEQNKCYNICFDSTAPMRGRKHSAESKRKLSILKKGIGNSFYGKHHTDECKIKISNALKKLYDIPEIKNKMIKNRTVRIGSLAPNYGKRHTEETKQKMRESRKNISEETRLKMSISHIGLKRSEEIKIKMRNSAHKGKFHCHYNHTTYHFLNKYTNEIFNGTQYEFQKKYNLKQCSVSAFIKKRMKTLFGWIVNN